MNKRKYVLALLLLLAVGFASVATNLVLNATVKIGKSDDFIVKFTNVVLDGEQSNFLILEDGKKLNFSTKELMKVGDTSVLNYEVTNNSKNYDAEVSVDCTIPSSDYYEVTKETPSEVKAKSTANGTIRTVLKKVSTADEYTESFTCTLSVKAKEKNAVGVETYSVSGILRDNNGDPLSNQTVAVFSTPVVTTTDDYGYFYVGGLESGSHDIYVLSGSVEDYTNKTKEQIKALASEILSSGTITTEGESSITNGYTINEAPMGTEPALAPGLYASDGTVGYTWEELKSEGLIRVNNGAVIGPEDYGKMGGLVGNLVLDEEVTSIGEYAFGSCESLTSIKIPASVTSIGNIAFDGCTSLTGIKVDENNPKYDSRNNSNAIIETATNTLIKGTSNTRIPESVTSIGEAAFYGTRITSIEIPNGVTSIGKHAFEECENLTSATFVNPNGWQAGSNELSSTDLTNTSTAATYLKDTYFNKNWTRS